jgi:transposase
MRKIIRVRELTEAERKTLVEGTRSRAGFTLRRSQILLHSADGLTTPQIAARLHCGEQTVRNVIGAFEREGVGCLVEKSHRPHQDGRVFDAARLQQLEQLLHRWPREFGQASSVWTLLMLAQVCLEQGVIHRAVSDETIRRALGKLGIQWQRARKRITSHDPQYTLKKNAETAWSRGRSRMPA